jgi:hypothetical protein
MRINIRFLGMNLLLILCICFASIISGEEVSGEKGLKVLRDAAVKYSGSHEVKLFSGITLRP